MSSGKVDAVDIAEFLLARIAEDAAVDERFGLLVSVEHHEVGCDLIAAHTDYGPSCDCGGPKRWLAECEAKLRIVELHRAAPDEIGALFCDTCCDDASPYGVAWPCETIKTLALALRRSPGLPAGVEAMSDDFEDVRIPWPPSPTVEPPKYYYYPSPDPEMPPAGVTEGYLVLWDGKSGPAQMTDAAMLHEGDGSFTIVLSVDGFRPTEVVDDRDTPQDNSG